MQKLRQYLYLRAFSIVIYESLFPTNRCFFSFFVRSVNHKFYFGHFQVYGQCLYYSMSQTVLHRKNFYAEKLISTVGHFFSYFLLINKLDELNAFKLCNIFQSCPEV